MTTTPETKVTGEISSDMPLLDFVVCHYMQSVHGTKAKRPPRVWVFKSLRRVCGVLKNILKREPTLNDLTQVNADAIAKALAEKCEEITIRKYCGLLLAVWRYAADLGIILLPWELRRCNGNPIHRHPENDKMAFPLVDSPLTLWGICSREFLPANLRARSPNTRHQYMLSVRNFAAFLGRQPTLSDLTDDTVTAWTKVMLDTDKSVYTTRERVGRVLALWRWCAARRKVEQFPTVRRPDAPELVPFAFDASQLQALFKAAAFENGKIGGVHAGDWWQSLFAFIWSTAERRGAALALRWEHIDFERGWIVIPPQFRKGGKKVGCYALWPEVRTLFERIREPARELVFPWPHSQGAYYFRFKRILRRAELPTHRKALTHCLRASHATWLQVLGGNATRALGHSDAATTAKHYLDPRLIPQEERRLFVPWGEQPAFPPPSAELDPALAWL